MKSAIRVLGLLVLLLAVTAIPAWASQGVGSSPYTADLLVSGLNTGSLNPGQEYWYAYSRVDLGDPEVSSIILSLSFEAAGRAVASRVNFQVFNFEQVDAWLKDNSGPVDSMGLGAPASADFDTATGERLWAGPVEANQVYYVRIFNLSPSPVQYRLTALGQKGRSSDAFLNIEASAASRPPTAVPAAVETKVDQPAAGTPLPAPTDLLPASFDAASPASTRWLLAAQAIQGLPPQQAAAWLMAAVSMGWLPGGSGSTAALVPAPPQVDQTGTTGGDGSGDQPGTEPQAVPVSPDPSRGDSIYPNRPLTLFEGSNVGRMAPKTEHWYTFTHDDLDEDLIEGMSLTLFFTPGEPNIGRNVTFEMFTGSQYQIWERGTPDDMEHFGVGSWVSRDGDYMTGERLWHGSIVDGDRYFVKVTNNSDYWIDYHLLTGDIINIEMGPQKAVPTEPAELAVQLPPTGKDIGSALVAQPGIIQSRLAAGEDIWYRFTPTGLDPDRPELQRYVMTLMHTPGAGYVANHVNVEIYPYPELNIWRRGDTDKITPLGVGSRWEYNPDTDTQTFVWDGHLVSQTTYFIRVRNDSSRPINFDLRIQKR